MIDQWSATGGLMRHCNMKLWTERFTWDGPRWTQKQLLLTQTVRLGHPPTPGIKQMVFTAWDSSSNSHHLGVHRKGHGRGKSFITTIINHSSSPAVPQTKDKVFQWLDMCPEATQPLLNCQSLQPLLNITFTTSVYNNSWVIEALTSHYNYHQLFTQVITNTYIVKLITAITTSSSHYIRHQSLQPVPVITNSSSHYNLHQSLQSAPVITTSSSHYNQHQSLEQVPVITTSSNHYNKHQSLQQA